MRQKVLDCLRAPASVEIIGSPADDADIRGQLARDQAGVGLRPEADSKNVATLDNVDDGIRRIEVDLLVRMEQLELPQERGEATASESDRRRRAQDPGCRLPTAGHRHLGFLDLGKDTDAAGVE